MPICIFHFFGIVFCIYFANENKKQQVKRNSSNKKQKQVIENPPFAERRKKTLAINTESEGTKTKCKVFA